MIRSGMTVAARSISLSVLGSTHFCGVARL